MTSGPAPRIGQSGAQASLPDPGPWTPDPGLSDEPPPVGGSWATLYAVVLGTLAILILLFYSFTKAFE
jgi:hypothetical protein